MGPGANAQADQMILSSALPNVFFWNQPQQKNAVDAFKNLVDAAEKEVRKLVSANGGSPVKVVAHSFGAHLFHHLTLRDPKLFHSCAFYGTGYDVPGGFFKLLGEMGRDPSTPSDLREKIADFLRLNTQPNASEIWSYIGLIAQDPAFFRHYWPTPNIFSAFASVAMKTDPMDMESFQNILNDFLNYYFKPGSLTASPWQGPIEILLGDRDPLIEVSKETALWKTIFPQAHIKVLKNSGHFIHLEKYLKD